MNLGVFFLGWKKIRVSDLRDIDGPFPVARLEALHVPFSVAL